MRAKIGKHYWPSALSRCRERAGLSLRDVAAITGHDMVGLAEIEEWRLFPTLEILKDLARLYDVDVQEFALRDPERRLTFRFLTLPFRHQIAVALSLDVLTDQGDERRRALSRDIQSRAQGAWRGFGTKQKAAMNIRQGTILSPRAIDVKINFLALVLM